MVRRSKATELLVLLVAATPPVVGQNLGPNAIAEAVGPTTEGLYISPKNGQSAKQMWSDRYACSGWAKSQSGVDPTHSTEAAPTETGARRDAYRRAMAACLESHGYSVSDTPSSSVPASQPPSAAAAAPVPPPPNQQILVRQYTPAPQGFQYHPLRAQIEGGYTVPAGSAGGGLDGGWNAGLGLTWFPSSVIPLGLRLDGSFSRFNEASQSVGEESESLNTPVSFGHEDIYGGDLDAEFDLPIGSSVREYFFGGVGQYREQTTYKQVSSAGYCFYFCGAYVVDVEQSTSRWLNSWNAGVGFEFASADPASFFVEARYQHIGSADSRTEFVPIRVGIRF
jgi:opacity protein-like surface antigen